MRKRTGLLLHGRDHINQASQLQENSRKVALRVRPASPPTALVSVESLAHPPARKVKSATVFDRYAGPGRRHVFRPAFTGWPLPEPSDWAKYVNLPQTEAALEAVRRCLRRGCPYGTRIWAEQTRRQARAPIGARRADVARIQDRPQTSCNAHLAQYMRLSPLFSPTFTLPTPGMFSKWAALCPSYFFPFELPSARTAVPSRQSPAAFSNLTSVTTLRERSPGDLSRMSASVGQDRLQVSAEFCKPGLHLGPCREWAVANAPCIAARTPGR